MKARNILFYFVWIIFSINHFAVGQETSTSYTSSYTGEYGDFHAHVKDKGGHTIEGISTVSGKGTHSILGEVTSFTYLSVYNDRQNVVDFVETDAMGNSIYVTAVGRDGDAKNGWYADGIITGGSGKYKGASGTYNASGNEGEGTTSWSATGILYLKNGEDAEIEAIREVISKETTSFYKGDMDAWSKTVVNDDFLEGIYVTNNGVTSRYNGFSKMKAAMESYSDLPDTLPKITRTNWNIQLRDNVAWATYHQSTIQGTDSSSSVESRIMEKINGQWRIAMSVVCPNVEKSK